MSMTTFFPSVLEFLLIDVLSSFVWSINLTSCCQSGSIQRISWFYRSGSNQVRVCLEKLNSVLQKRLMMAWIAFFSRNHWNHQHFVFTGSLCLKIWLVWLFEKIKCDKGENIFTTALFIATRLEMPVTLYNKYKISGLVSCGKQTGLM